MQKNEKSDSGQPTEFWYTPKNRKQFLPSETDISFAESAAMRGAAKLRATKDDIPDDEMIKKGFIAKLILNIQKLFPVQMRIAYEHGGRLYPGTITGYTFQKESDVYYGYVEITYDDGARSEIELYEFQEMYLHGDFSFHAPSEEESTSQQRMDLQQIYREILEGTSDN